MANCQRCDAQIMWLKTEKARPIPVDVEPSPDGNLRLANGIAYYVTRPKPGEPPPPQRSLFEPDPDEMPPAPPSQLDRAVFETAHSAPLYLSHFVTCPHAAEFRKRTPEGGGTGRRTRSPRSPRR